MNNQESFCQSCAMPMAEAALEDWGTNADGSPSGTYCSYCYQDGQLADLPDEEDDDMTEVSAGGWDEQDPLSTFKSYW